MLPRETHLNTSSPCHREFPLPPKENPAVRFFGGGHSSEGCYGDWEALRRWKAAIQYSGRITRRASGLSIQRISHSEIQGLGAKETDGFPAHIQVPCTMHQC